MPFSKGGPAGEATAVAGGKAPTPPSGRKCAFDGRQAVKMLGVTFAESNKGSPLARRKREEGLI